METDSIGVYIKVACSRVSDSEKDAKKKNKKNKKHAKSWRGAKKEKVSPVSPRFIFVFALYQFSGPDYLGAWNRLILKLNGGIIYHKLCTRV